MLWYVLQVKTGSEIKVRDRLQRLGILAVVPQEEKLIHKAGKWLPTIKTLFTGYVFVHITYDADSHYKIKDDPSVIKFVGCGNSPSSLSYLEAEWIRLLSFEGLAIKPTKMHEGEDGKLYPVEGVLTSFENKIIKVDRHSKKATFEISICGEPHNIELSIEIV